MGAGGAVPNAGALAAEFSPLSRRPAAVKLTIVCIPLGGMLGGLIAAYMLPIWGWRALYTVGGILPLAFAVVLWFVLPESPRFLSGQPSRGEELAKFLRRIGYSNLPLGSQFRPEALPGGPTASQGSLRALLSLDLRRDTLGLWVAFFFSLSGVFLVFGWLPALLTSQGLSVAASSTGLAFYNFGGVLGVLLWAVLTTVSGSRKPMLAGTAGAAATALLILTVPVDAVFLTAAIGVHGALINAVQTSMYALAAHVYPTAIRATGVACAATMGRTGAILSSLSGAAIVGRGPEFFWSSIAVGLLVTFCGLALVRRHIPARSRN
jgi:MFS transporter, AAHS family, 4-hydroxybenzoate transporter